MQYISALVVYGIQAGFESQIDNIYALWEAVSAGCRFESDRHQPLEVIRIEDILCGILFSEF